MNKKPKSSGIVLQSNIKAGDKVVNVTDWDHAWGPACYHYYYNDDDWLMLVPKKVTFTMGPCD